MGSEPFELNFENLYMSGARLLVRNYYYYEVFSSQIKDIFPFNMIKISLSFKNYLVLLLFFHLIY